MTRLLRATVQYDGTAFAGFQRQPGRTTVQGALESAIAQVTREDVTVTGAGRTDAGVHALGQVIHFQSASPLPTATLARAINACLPAGVALRDLDEAPEGFHARYSAVSREYRYVVECGSPRSPLWRERAYQVERPLDLEPMAMGAALLVGRHDFGAFGAPMMHTSREPGEGRLARGGTIRTMLAARCRRRSRFILFCFIADAFLRHMVRMLVGTLLRLGAGTLPVAAVGRLLAGDRTLQAGPAAPAHGLYLLRVRY